MSASLLSFSKQINAGSEFFYFKKLLFIIKNVKIIVEATTALMQSRISRIPHKTNVLLTVLMGTLKAETFVFQLNFVTQLATLAPSKTMPQNVQLAHQHY